jgi:3-oxoacyl-[acyl-carrier-protein] synthase-3
MLVQTFPVSVAPDTDNRWEAGTMPQLTTVERIEAFTPERSVPIENFTESLGVNRHQVKMFRRVHGFDQVRDDPDLGLFDLVARSGRALLATVADRAAVRYLIYAHTVLTVTPAQFDAATEIRDRLDLPGADAFAVTNQYCASGFAALDVASELLRADGDPNARALVVMGEKPFTPMIRLVANTTIIGEASAACLVGIGDGSAGEIIRSYVANTVGVFRPGVRLPPEVLKQFNDSYVDLLAGVMREALDKAEVDLADIALVVPHNVSKLLWVRTIDKLGLPRERVYLDTIPVYSHCCCVDPFLNFALLRDAGRLVDGGLYLLTTVGMGASYAAMVVEHREARP